ncbi:hypothetical protein VNI00_017693 [Paramarasmius palmivorus]|uniref:Uncharacterized protein n=1 Tax=Paramarasmius palmivorus TaxID=297713 RepID=A0AAW0B5H7_9AGAR
MTSSKIPYFQNPSNYLQTLQSTGWKEMEHTDEKHRFWTRAWDQKEPPKSLGPSEFAEPMADSSYQAETFPTSLDELPRALLREEYRRMYDGLCALGPDPQPKGGRRTAVPITGHPGIGKTIFRDYALYRRCLEGKPTLYFDESTLYLFHEGGVLSLGKDVHTDLTTLDPFTPDTRLLLDGPSPQLPIPNAFCYATEIIQGSYSLHLHLTRADGTGGRSIRCAS